MTGPVQPSKFLIQTELSNISSSGIADNETVEPQTPKHPTKWMSSVGMTIMFNLPS